MMNAVLKSLPRASQGHITVSKTEEGKIKSSQHPHKNKSVTGKLRFCFKCQTNED
jgi:hypothetical protein